MLMRTCKQQKLPVQQIDVFHTRCKCEKFWCKRHAWRPLYFVKLDWSCGVLGVSRDISNVATLPRSLTTI